MPDEQNLLWHTLRNVHAQGRMALCGYFLAGYPTPQEFYRLVRAASQLDVIEFGIPALNPLMDGAVIAHAHEVVTQQRGIDAETALALIGGLRHIPQPRLVMTYSEVGRSLHGFLRLCVENGVHGILAPDFAPGEGQYVSLLAHALNLTLFTLLDARADAATFQQQVELGDIIYLKAAPGPTGQAADLAELRPLLLDAIQRIHQIKPEMPIAVGIGLQKPEQVALLAELGITMAIIGTKIIEKLIDGEEALIRYLATLHQATYFPTR